MDFSWLGGITLAAVAVLWIVFFIPSWFHRSQDKTFNRSNRREQATVVRELRQPRSNSMLSVAEKVHMLTTRIQFFLSLSILGFLTALVSVGLAFINPFTLFGAAAGLGVFALSRQVVRAASRERIKLSKVAARARTSIASSLVAWGTQDQALQLAQSADPRAWTPNVLPAPVSQLRVGELQVSAMAEVVNLEPKEQSKSEFLDSQKLDEILQRRRALG